MRGELKRLFLAPPELRHDVRGYHHGQLDCTIRLVSRAGETLARLDYSVYDGCPQIQMIHVLPTRRRRGYARRMLADLQARHPDREIDWGATTADGEALRRALPIRRIPTPEAPDFARLARLRGRLEAMECEIARLHAAGEDTRAAITAYYCLERHADDLAWRLEGAQSECVLLDLSGEDAASGAPPRVASDPAQWAPLLGADASAVGA